MIVKGWAGRPAEQTDRDGGGSGGGEKWSDAGSYLKVELAGVVTDQT